MNNFLFFDLLDPKNEDPYLDPLDHATSSFQLN